MRYASYHVYINKRYMTVTLDGFVADLLNIQLGVFV